MPTHLVWFRADLRIHDNFALAAACRAKDANVLALFIATPEQWRQHDMAPRQAALLSAYLNDLQHSLAEKGIPLIYKEAHDFAAQRQTVQAICQQHAVTHLYYNYQYEFNEQQRDRQLEKTLAGVVCEGFDDSVMLAPGSVMTGSHEMYKVFTPFKNAFIKRLKEGLPECVTAPTVRGETITVLPTTSDVKVLIHEAFKEARGTAISLGVMIAVITGTIIAILSFVFSVYVGH